MIERRRTRLEQQVGATACRKAQLYRRTRLRERDAVADFGRVVLKRTDDASKCAGNEKDVGVVANRLSE